MWMATVTLTIYAACAQKWSDETFAVASSALQDNAPEPIQQKLFGELPTYTQEASSSHP